MNALNKLQNVSWVVDPISDVTQKAHGLRESFLEMQSNNKAPIEYANKTQTKQVFQDMYRALV